jgi:O-antigen/teichoic acid export membrane protein
MRKKIMNNKLIRYIFEGEQRSVKIKTNMIISIIFKVATILLSFLIVKATYSSLTEEKFGVWMTLLSILSWITMFDVGLGNGLRNRLSESLAKEDWEKSKIYVSTTYALIGIIVLVLILVSGILIKFANISAIFNVSAELGIELRNAVFWITLYYLLNFLLSLINSISFSFHDSAIPDIIRFFTNLIIYIAFYIVSKVQQGNLFLIGFLYSFITFAITFIASLYLFNKRYKKITPTLKNVNFKYVKSLFSLSIGFFVIQIAGVVIFTTSNIVITQILGPKSVSPYQIVYKLFSIFTIGFGIVLAPLWSGFTDAYCKNDASWIKKALKSLLILMIPTTLGIILMIIFAKPIIKVWIGDDVGATTLLIILMGIYTIQGCWNSIFANFVNGIGRIRLQIYTAIIGGIINIPLSIYLARDCGLGVSGVILGTICSLMLGTILIPIQTYKIIQNELK